MELKLDRNKTYGLALEGGGAKGAYQIGAWKALREAGIRFSAVSGTSVGALNGAMIVMDDLQKAEDVWNNIHFSQVMDVDDEEMRRLMTRDIPLSELKGTLRSVAEIIRNRGFDVTPLRKWVAEVVDADKVCNSDTDFFIVTYSLSDHQELELRASDLSRDELCDMLLASAYLPAFRLEKLGGKYYADGGVQDVVPIHALVEDGCKDIIALRIFGFGIEKRFRIPDDVHVTTIGPTVDLGNILNFDAEQSRRNMRLGYFDAQRVLYGLYGSTYYIDRTMSEDTARQQLLEYIGLGEHSLRTFHEKALPQIAKALKCDGDYYDLLIAVLEHDARALGIESERIVTDMELLQTLLAQPEPPEQTPETETEAPAAPDAQAPADADVSALSELQDMIRILSMDAGVWQLQGEDERFARWLLGYDGLLSFSQAHREGDRIRILRGPLKDMEGRIVRVDKRGRSGQVLLNFNGREIAVWLGFELVEEENPLREF